MDVEHADDPEPAVAMRGLTKHYGHVHALRGADLDLHPGEIVGLVGDNGAGKSTLVKILAGTIRADEGTVCVEGRPTELRAPGTARAAGIETVYQDLALAPDLDAVQNLYLGREVLGGGIGRWAGVLRDRAMRAQAPDLLGQLSLRLPRLDVPVGSLSGGQRQLVAIARAMAWSSKVVLLDEPTAALGVQQTEQVTKLVQATAERGVAVLIVSHDLPELLELAHRIVVLRLGRVVAVFPAAEATATRLLAAMTGLADRGAAA